jgi:hypothetical protein
MSMSPSVKALALDALDLAQDALHEATHTAVAARRLWEDARPAAAE